MIGDPNLPREPSAYPRLITRLYDLFRKIGADLHALNDSVSRGASLDPGNIGDVVIEFTDNTTLTLKAKGSDGVIRSATVTLS